MSASDAEVERKQRQPHAALGLQSRRLKALKIERLLDLASRPQPMRMLEIGTGSGGIAHYFATHPHLQIRVDAVDIVDNRSVEESYQFQLVSGTVLPFEDGTFDVVLTNHVIEHVGDQAAQLAHLSEIRRVLRVGGVGYLAVPNRWQFIEPHYGLALLSWWPHSWRSAYLRMFRDATFYDCEPLTSRQLERMLDQSGFAFSCLGVAAIRQTLELEYPVKSVLRTVCDRIPDDCISAVAPMIPTLIYRLHDQPREFRPNVP